MNKLNEEQSAELFNLYHLARAAGKQSRYERMLYASKHFSEAHPEVSSTCAYKHLDRSFQ